jgi:hypothetical protein
MNADSSPDVVIIEWRHTGHNLGYVAAIARAAMARGKSVRVVATPEVVGSPEAVQLTGVPIRIDTRLKQRVGVLRAIQDQSSSTAVVVQHADEVRWQVAVAALRRSRPQVLSLVMLRSPGSRLRRQQGRGLLRTLAGAVRAADSLVCFALLARTRVVDLHLLESPLSAPGSRHWGWPLLRPDRTILDPADLLPVTEEPKLPPELDDVDDDTQLFLVIGSIDGRKHVGPILDAWRLVADEGRRALVLAGRVAPRVLETIATRQSRGVHVVDRFITDAEFSGLLNRSQAVFALSDNPSGVMLAACQHLCWTIARAGSGGGSAVERLDIGEVTTLSPDALADAVRRVSKRGGMRRAPTLSGTTEFGAQVLRRLT